jgi:hypothetical protein
MCLNSFSGGIGKFFRPYVGLGLLMTQNHSSKVFPPVADKGGGSSRHAMKSCRQRLMEACARAERRAL